jgi:ubiquinone/menaquinone biosynthesis C-methylase UbiE
VGNVIQMPFPDRAFDAVVCVRLLPHCEAWPAFVAELCRVAARQVIVDYPTNRSLNKIAPAFFGAKKQIEGNTRTWRMFHPAEIAAEFRKHGYRIERQIGQFFFPMVLHRMLKCRPLSAALEGASRMVGLGRLFGSPVIVKMVRL